MKDTVLKLRILWDYLREAHQQWIEAVWTRDLDERYCCSGSECCCGGETVRSVHFPQAVEEVE